MAWIFNPFTGTFDYSNNPSGAAVSTFSAGTTGFTPNTATSGAVTLAGTLNVTNGGTGLTAVTAGYIPFGSTATALATNSTLAWDNANSRLAIGGGTIPNKLTIRCNTVNGDGIYLYNTDGATFTNYVSLFQNGPTGYGISGWLNSMVFEAVPSASGGTQGNFVLGAYAGNIIFQTGARTSRMTISAAGNTSLGSTTLDIGKLSVYQTSITTSAANLIDRTLAALTIAGSSGVSLVLGTDVGSPYGAYIQATGAGSGNWPIYLNPAGNVNAAVLIGTTTAGASRLVVNDSSIQINTAKTPASASATGTTGQVCWDADYIYVCTASNTWKRAGIATW